MESWACGCGYCAVDLGSVAGLCKGAGEVVGQNLVVVLSLSAFVALFKSMADDVGAAAVFHGELRGAIIDEFAQQLALVHVPAEIGRGSFAAGKFITSRDEAGMTPSCINFDAGSFLGLKRLRQ